MPENIVAYHSGRRRWRRRGERSQTSLPSQCGPMVRTVCVRSSSFFATILSRAPTPKSKPSVTR